MTDKPPAPDAWAPTEPAPLDTPPTVAIPTGQSSEPKDGIKLFQQALEAQRGKGRET